MLYLQYVNYYRWYVSDLFRKNSCFHELPILGFISINSATLTCKVAMATLSPQMAMTIDCDKLLSVPSGLLGFSGEKLQRKVGKSLRP